MASARDFHDGCGGHATTLALIEDTRGHIFAGFTLVEWELEDWWYRRTDESFVFPRVVQSWVWTSVFRITATQASGVSVTLARTFTRATLAYAGPLFSRAPRFSQ
jgi:hypothetical protein